MSTPPNTNACGINLKNVVPLDRISILRENLCFHAQKYDVLSSLGPCQTFWRKSSKFHSFLQVLINRFPQILRICSILVRWLILAQKKRPSKRTLHRCIQVPPKADSNALRHSKDDIKTDFEACGKWPFSAAKVADLRFLHIFL